MGQVHIYRSLFGLSLSPHLPSVHLPTLSIPTVKNFCLNLHVLQSLAFPFFWLFLHSFPHRSFIFKCQLLDTLCHIALQYFDIPIQYY